MLLSGVDIFVIIGSAYFTVISIYFAISNGYKLYYVKVFRVLI